MHDMFKPTFLIGSLVFAVCCGACSRSAPHEIANSTPPANNSASPGSESSGIELEIVTSQPLEGSITATGKVLATDDHTASIGPVHEGRIVRLYAGQGSEVMKGQKLADLESADIDQAEADYLKAAADLEN